MSATVHRLFPGSTADAAESELPPNPLVELMCSTAVPVLVRQIGFLFDGADDALFGMSQRATAAEDHQASFDSMRMLRMQRRNIESEFERALRASFQPAEHSLIEEFDLDRLAVMPTEELEENIAISHLLDKAEHLHEEALADWQRRRAHMIRDLGIPISRQSLSPESICNAFKSCLSNLDLTLTTRLLLYKLFDGACISRLDQVYSAALGLLDAHGIQVEAPAELSEPSWPLFDAAPVTVAPAEPPSRPTLDTSTLATLENVARQGGGVRPQDAAFAQELLVLAQTDSATGVAPAQRMSLVGQMCNEILSDPHLPPAMRPLFERLRFPLIKISLADGSFFKNRIHPVRRLVAEAAETAAASRVASHVLVKRLEDRLRQIAEQTDLSSTFVRPQLAYLPVLTMIDIASFLDQQREESETRRENVLNKVRRTVAQELEVHTLGRKPPAALINFLRVGWGPLMAARLLRHGMNSRMWIEAVNRLVQVLSMLGGAEPSPEQQDKREQILASIGTDLADIGMREEKIVVALNYLRKAFVDHDASQANRSPQEREQDELELFSPMVTGEVQAQTSKPAPLPAWPDMIKLPAPDPGVEEATGMNLVAAASLAVSAASIATAASTSSAASAASAATSAASAASAAATAVATTLATPKIPAKSPEAAPLPRQSPSKASTDAIPVVHLAEANDNELLGLCLTPESWFRVFDAKHGQTLWLKVYRFSAEHGSVGFNGFDPKKALSITAVRFVDDLIHRRSEPVNPSPVQVRAMAELRRRRHS